jgi:hypothetical protein
MKTFIRFLSPARRLYWFMVALGIGLAGSLSATVITWTNSSNGNWSGAANWSPNQVPSTNDIAAITNAGTYTVTLNTDSAIAGLLVGGSSGTQSVATAGNTLTLNGAGDVSLNGRVLLSGGALSGTNQIKLAGAMTWEAGAIDTNAAVTVAASGVVTLASSGNHAKYLHGSLTNSGLITWRMYGNFGIGGTLHNRAGALFDAQVTNRFIISQGDSALIANDGIFRKSTGSGDLTCSVPLHNSGTVDTMVGTLTFTGGSVLQTGSTFIGAGQTRLGAGSHTLNGDLQAMNLVLYGATVAGAARLNGRVTWAEGTIANGAAITVAAGSHLLMSSTGNDVKHLHGSLTNAGHITFSPYGSLNIGGILHNLAGALFDVQTTYNGISQANSTAVIINDGVFRRSSTSTIVACAVPIINNGTVEALAGTLAITDAFSNPQGTISLAGGTITLSQPLVLAGGLLTGWGTLNADVTNGACIWPSCSNGVLTINGKCAQLLGGHMEFELAGNEPGTNQSRLNITGAATLRGTVGVRWADGYLPAPGTNFSVLAFASRQGEFCCFDNLLLLGQGRRLTPGYGATSFTLATIAAPEPTTVPLRVTVDDGALVCWPVEFPGCELYWSTNLSQTNWTVIAGATNRWLESAPLAREKFFRLHKP